MGLRDTLKNNQGKAGADEQDYLEHLRLGKYRLELQTVVDGEYGDHKGAKAGMAYNITEWKVIEVLRKDSGDEHWQTGEPWESNEAGTLAKVFIELQTNAKGYTTRGKNDLKRLKRVGAAVMSSDLGEPIAPQDLDDDQIADWAESGDEYGGTQVILDLTQGKNYTEIRAFAVSSD